MSAWQNIREQMDAQTVKVRLLLVVVALSLFITGSVWLIGNLSDEYQQQVWKLRLLPEKDRKQQQELATQLAASENSQIQSLQQQIEAAGRKLDHLKYARLDYVRGISGAGQLQHTVDSLLRKNGGLTLIRLQTLKPEALLPEAVRKPDASKGENTVVEKDATKTDGQDKIELQLQQADFAEGLYRHGLQLSVRGSWFDLVDYLEQLEDMDLHVFWHSLNLKAGPYPYSTMTLNLFTVSGKST